MGDSFTEHFIEQYKLRYSELQISKVQNYQHPSDIHVQLDIYCKIYLDKRMEITTRGIGRKDDKLRKERKEENGTRGERGDENN